MSPVQSHSTMLSAGPYQRPFATSIRWKSWVIIRLRGLFLHPDEQLLSVTEYFRTNSMRSCGSRDQYLKNQNRVNWFGKMFDSADCLGTSRFLLYDSVNRSLLVEILLVDRVPQKLIDFMKAYHENTPARANIHGEISLNFSLLAGLRQMPAILHLQNCKSTRECHSI